MKQTEANEELQAIADECVTEGDVLERVSKLSDAKKFELVSSISQREFFNDTKEWSVSFLNWLEAQQLINNYERGTSDLRPALGMVRMLAQLLTQAYSAQARIEMQTQTKNTQWGMSVADRLSDCAGELKELSEAMIVLGGYYDTVLKGRRMGVEFQDEEGTHIPANKNPNSEENVIKED